MNRTVAIVQGRVGSTRLPGKILRPLVGKTVLAHVLERCRAVPGVDAVCCATTENAEDDAIVVEAKRCDVAVFRGSCDDVLSRYARAAEAMDASVILRVTSDCPAMDPAVCGGVLALRKCAAAGYVSNNMPPSWPHGLDCEAFTREALAAADGAAADPFEREHVSPWMRMSEAVRRANLEAPIDLSRNTRWTLDYPQDYAFFEALFEHLPTGEAGFSMATVLDLLNEYPEISAINRMRHGATKAAPFGVIAVSKSFNPPSFHSVSSTRQAGCG